MVITSAYVLTREVPAYALLHCDVARHRFPDSLPGILPEVDHALDHGGVIGELPVEERRHARHSGHASGCARGPVDEPVLDHHKERQHLDVALLRSGCFLTVRKKGTPVGEERLGLSMSGPVVLTQCVMTLILTVKTHPLH